MCWVCCELLLAKLLGANSHSSNNLSLLARVVTVARDEMQDRQVCCCRCEPKIQLLLSLLRAHQYGAVSFTRMVGPMAQKYTRPTALEAISLAPAIMMT